jgi:hypothetical protein
VSQGEIPRDVTIAQPRDTAISFHSTETGTILSFRADGSLEIGRGYTPSDAGDAVIANLREQLARLYLEATDDSELKVRVVNLEGEVTYWRERAATYEALHGRLEHAAADVRGRVEQFLTILNQARPQGTDRRA